MQMSRSLLATILLAPCLLVSAAAQHLSADGGVQTFNYLADQYFTDVYFHFSPTNGTVLFIVTSLAIHPNDPLFAVGA